MDLKEHFESSGNWLFRRRSYLPLVLVIIIGISMAHYKYISNSEAADMWWEITCLLVSFFGLAIRAWTIACVPAKTSGRNTGAQIADKLNTTGIYSIVRHPLYLGNYFMMLGVVMFTHDVWVVLVYSLLFALYYERIMCAEEAFLKRKFGDDYVNWTKTTPAFFPKFSLYRKAELDFSITNVLRREYNGFFAVIISMFILELFGDFIIMQKLHLDTFWLILLGFGFVVWMTLRSMRKYTKWLSGSGR